MTTISRLCTIHGAACRHVLLLASTQIEVAFRRWSAVAVLARLPGTAALSFLLDQGVIGSQPMPAHFAAVTSTEHFTTKMIKFRHSHSDVCAAHRASSSQVGSERVLVRVWCSYVFATYTRRTFVCTGPYLSKSSKQTHDEATFRIVGVRRGSRALRRMERRRVLALNTYWNFVHEKKKRGQHPLVNNISASSRARPQMFW